MSMKILSIAAIVAVVAVLGFIILTEGGSEPFPLPDIGPLTHEVGYVELEATVQAPAYVWDQLTVTINPLTVRTTIANEFLSIGPFWLADVNYTGEIIAEALKGGRVVSTDRKNYSVDSEWYIFWRQGTEQTLPFGKLRLGDAGTGTYVVRVTIYDKNGLIVDSDQVNVTI